MPNFDRSTEKHAHQNIQNDYHQWLSHSFRVHHTVLAISTKNKVVFLRSVCCNNVFFHSGNQTGIVITTIPKTSWWIENCTKFGQFILSKIIKIVATRCGAPPDPLAGFKGCLLLRGGEGGGREKGREGRGRGEGREGEGESRGRAPFCKFLDPPLFASND